jgi:hypothetical protein
LASEFLVAPPPSREFSSEERDGDAIPRIFSSLIALLPSLVFSIPANQTFDDDGHHQVSAPHSPIRLHPHPAFGDPLRRRSLRCAADSSPDPTTNNNPLAALIEVPRALWRRTLQPLGDYGFGKRSVWEGGVGLFMVSGAALLALALAWLRGFQLRSRFRNYHTVFEFTQASGICVGTPVRIRGVTVGSVVRVDSSLRSIDAHVQVT